MRKITSKDVTDAFKSIDRKVEVIVLTFIAYTASTSSIPYSFFLSCKCENTCEVADKLVEINRKFNLWLHWLLISIIVLLCFASIIATLLAIALILFFSNFIQMAILSRPSLQ